MRTKSKFSVFLADIVSSEDRQGRMKEMKGENPPLVKQMSIDTLNLEAETTCKSIRLWVSLPLLENNKCWRLLKMQTVLGLEVEIQAWSNQLEINKAVKL